MSIYVTSLYKYLTIQNCYMSTNVRKTGILVGFIDYKFIEFVLFGVKARGINNVRKVIFY